MAACISEPLRPMIRSEIMFTPIISAMALATAVNGSGRSIFPGAVTDAEQTIGFFMDGSNGIQAVHLANGQQVWDSKDGIWPLEVINGQLYAAAPIPDRPHEFKIETIDATTGRASQESSPIDLPSWVTPTWTYDQPSGYRFDLSSESYDNHILLIRWSARKWSLDKTQAPLRDCGYFQLDTQTGKIEPSFLQEQPHLFRRNLLRDSRPDPTEPRSYVLGPDLRTETYEVYLSETVPTPDTGKHPLRLVGVDPDTNQVLWQKPLGTRSTSGDTKCPDLP